MSDTSLIIDAENKQSESKDIATLLEFSPEESKLVGENTVDVVDQTNQDMDDFFAQHGGDPRLLDLGRCLLVSNLPSTFLSDTYDVFSECMYEMLCHDFNVSRDAMEKVIRIPKLQSDSENQESALRAIVSFKSRVHKHRVFAQKKLAVDSLIKVGPLEEIPREFLEIEEDLEMADEVGDEESPEEQVGREPEHESEKTDTELKNEPPVNESIETSGKEETIKSTNNGHGEAHYSESNTLNVPEQPKKKTYVNEDDNALFEINWDGAPEFQWKLCPTPLDTRRLILENVFWSDLRNPFIYRVMIKAETVDISFPMRYNIEGNKQMYGKVTMIFQWSNQIMMEALHHLIYVRCAGGRRIKVFLPQTPQAVKMKEDFEGKLGRLIKPTPRMHQLIIKVLPKDHVVSKEDAQNWFPEQTVTNVENTFDELGQPCAVLTMVSVDDVIDAHSSRSFVSITVDGTENHKCHVFLRGVEAHFGSFLTRWDRKKMEREAATRATCNLPLYNCGFHFLYQILFTTAKRAASDDSKVSFAKKPRGNNISANRGGRGSGVVRGSSFSRGRGFGRNANSPQINRRCGLPARQPQTVRRGRDSFGVSRNLCEPFNSLPTSSSRGVVGSTQRSTPFDSRFDFEEKIRAQRHEIELQEQMLRQQQIIDNMAAKLRERDRLSRSAFDLDRPSGTFGSGRDSFGSSLSGAPRGQSNYSSSNFGGHYSNSGVGSFNSGRSSYGSSGGHHSGGSGYDRRRSGHY